MLLENEKIKNKASNYYRKITLLESRTFQCVAFGVVLLHAAVMSGLVDTIGISLGFENALTDFIAIACEGTLLYLVLVVARVDEYRFNKLVRDGIVLKTEINHRLSRKTFSSNDTALQIFSFYLCEDGEKLTFSQTKSLNIMRQLDIFIEKKLEQERYINVLVNPVKCSEYYIIVHEVGVKPEKKYEVPYGNKIVSIILLLLVVLEYLVWMFLF